MSAEKYMTVGELLELKSWFIDECVNEGEFDKWNQQYFGRLFCEKKYFSQNPFIRMIRRFFFHFHPLKILYEKGHRKIWREDIKIVDLNDYFCELSTKLWINPDFLKKLNRLKNEGKEKRIHIAECRDKIEEFKKKAENQKIDKANKILFYCADKEKEINDIEKKIHEYEVCEIYKDALEDDSSFLMSMLNNFDRFFFPNVMEEGKIISLCKFPQLPLNMFGQVSGLWEMDKEKFYQTAQEYVENYKIYDDCVALINNEAYFSDVKDSIKKTLDYFDKDPFAFCMLAAANIEGVISMYCLDLGYGEREVLGNAISEKVKLLQKKRLMTSIHLDYYTFLYPVFRNRIMHGVQQSPNWKFRACAIILDLHAVLKKFESKKLHSNIIRKVKNDNKNGYCYQGMIALLAVDVCLRENVDSEVEFLIKKYHDLFLKDIMTKIDGGEKVDYFCSSFAKRLDKKSIERKKIFASLKPQEEAWSFLERRADVES